MRILLISTEKLPVPNIRGGAIQTYIHSVSRMLAAFHQITILGVTDPNLPVDEVVNGIRYVRIPSEGLLDLYAAGIKNFLNNSGERYDLIHIFNRPRLVLPVRSSAPQARIVLSMHNDMFGPEKIRRDEAEAAIAETERIITISNYIGNEISRLFPQAQSKCVTVYSGVDLSRFAPWRESNTSLQARESIRQQYGLGNKKVILFVGRLSRNKGPHVLVRAMHQLAHSDAVLVIVGGAWYSVDKVSDYIAYVRALAERSAIPVITTGYVQGDEVHRWFHAADIFVCTSIWQEPLARVHYEAMAAGLPFLTTNRGGNPEIVVNDNGVLINDPTNAAEYAQALNRLLSDMELCRRMGLNGRRLAERYFTWERVANDILSVWERR